MREEDWSREELEMTAHLERITAQHATQQMKRIREGKTPEEAAKEAAPPMHTGRGHAEMPDFEKPVRRRKTSTGKDPLRYAANVSALGVLAYFAVTALLTAALQWAFAQFHEGATLEHPVSVPEWMLGLANMLLPVGGLLAAYLLIRALLKGSRLALHPVLKMPRKKELWLFLPVFLGISLLGNILTSVLQRFLQAHTRYAAPAQVRLPQDGLALLMYFIGICIIPAVFEELLVRGALQGLLARWGAWFSIVVSSVTFMLMHRDLAQMPAIFLESVLMGLAAYCTGTLAVGIALHLANNTMMFCFLYAAQVMDGVSALALTVYLVLIFCLAAVGCAAAIRHLHVMRQFKPIPRVYDPKNRQSRLERLASTPLYLILMLLLAARALLPLWIDWKG